MVIGRNATHFAEKQAMVDHGEAWKCRSCGYVMSSDEAEVATIRSSDPKADLVAPCHCDKAYIKNGNQWHMADPTDRTHFPGDVRRGLAEVVNARSEHPLSRRKHEV
jgi:hypothetical protein